MVESERLDCIVSHLGKKKNAVAKELGYTNSSVFYAIESGRNGISAGLAKKIADVYPEISQNWLLTGKGEMLNKTKPKETIEENNRIEVLERISKGLEARIELLEQKMKEIVK
jgi:plasmid maintenance system antidote protein VapI